MSRSQKQRAHWQQMQVTIQKIKNNTTGTPRKKPLRYDGDTVYAHEQTFHLGDTKMICNASVIFRK